jgi:tetratricopeptide (TPR) repeat protein
MMTELRRMTALGDAKAAQEVLSEILEINPGFMPAHRWQIDQLLEAQDYRAALDLCVQTDARFPGMVTMTTTKQAIACDRLGQRGKAIRLLADLHSRDLQDHPASAVYASLLFQTGKLDQARALYQDIHDANPAHPGALRGLIDIALAQERPEAALELCNHVLATSPALRPMALARQARCFEALDDTVSAIATLSDLLVQSPGDTAALLQLARLHQKSWNLEEADTLFAQVLERAPDHAAAWQGRVAVLLQKGDLDRALKINEQAIETLNPVPEALYRQRAHVLSMGDRSADAIDTLKQLVADMSTGAAIRLDLARAYLDAGDMARAADTFALCADHPDTFEAGVIGQVRVAQISGDDATAMGLLRATIGGGDRPLDADASPALVRLMCDTAVRTEQTAEIEMLLKHLVDHADALTDHDLRHVFALAERQALPLVATGLLEKVAGRTTLSLEMAKLLLKQAHVMADGKLIEQLAQVLALRLPATQQAVFKVEAQALIHGPVAALETARRTLPIPHTPRDASIIGRFLIDAGGIHTALRYLRRAARTWPSSRAVCSLYLHVCGLAGQTHAGHAHIDHLQSLFPGMDIGLDRLKLMHSQDASAEVLALATARRDKGLPGLHPRQYLDLCLASGDLDRAEAAMHDIRTDPDSSSRVAAYFTVGLQGRMLTDLRLYTNEHASQIRKGKPEDEIQAQLAEQYYYPAKCILDTWINEENRPADVAGRAPDNAIPAHIYQYWDAKTPPAEVTALIADWQAIPEFEHTLLDRTSATQMLRQHFGPRCVRAFQKARHVTEESDFLRLCLIYKFGGLYVDADDKAVGDIGAFARLGAGLVVAREPIGAVANNTLAAPPGHPILRIAIEMTMRSLMAYENDGAWFKTGPGMLTRAIARFITQNDPDAVRASLTVLDANTLRRFIQPHIRLPYKTTVKYWNAQDRKLSKRVLDSLMALS